MAAFDFVFTLIGLVLGLSLVEVLAGLARTLNARASTKIGWLTPLLGVFVILDVTSFWGICWSIRDMLPSVRLTLGAGVLFTSIYYMAATLVFPGHPEQFADLDQHYWRFKRQVVGLVFLVSLAVQLGGIALGRVWTTEIAVLNTAILSLMAFTAFVRGYWANIFGLSALIVIFALVFALL
jgi:hypothetical protein